MSDSENGMGCRAESKNTNTRGQDGVIRDEGGQWTTVPRAKRKKLSSGDFRNRSCLSVTNMTEIIKLNVGGCTYRTTKSTLCKYPNSMLGAMFGGTMATTQDENGCHFIDRNGEVFKYILDYLRSSRLCLSSDFKDLDQLSTEADFYQIQPLIDSIEQIKQTKVSILEVIESRMGECRTPCSQKLKETTHTIQTTISGRGNLIRKYLSPYLSPAQPIPVGYTEIPIEGPNIRLAIGECLQNQGWFLSESDNMLSCLPNDKDADFVKSFKERWTLTKPSDTLNERGSDIVTE